MSVQQLHQRSNITAPRCQPGHATLRHRESLQPIRSWSQCSLNALWRPRPFISIARLGRGSITSEKVRGARVVCVAYGARRAVFVPAVLVYAFSYFVVSLDGESVVDLLHVVLLHRIELGSFIWCENIWMFVWHNLHLDHRTWIFGHHLDEEPLLVLRLPLFKVIGLSDIGHDAINRDGVNAVGRLVPF